MNRSSSVVVSVFTLLTLACAGSAEDSWNHKHRLAILFNEAMNRCLQSDCANVDEMARFFNDDAEYLGDEARVTGRQAIKEYLLKVQVEGDTLDRVQGVDVMGSIVLLRMERLSNRKTDGQIKMAQVIPHLQVIVLSDTRIARLISLMSPEEE